MTEYIDFNSEDSLENPGVFSINTAIELLLDSQGSSVRKLIIKELDIKKIILRKVLPLFSKYYPNDVPVNGHLMGLYPEFSLYKLDECKLPILNVNRVIGGRQDFPSGGYLPYDYTTATVKSNRYLGVGTLESFISPHTAAASLFNNPITAKFTPPNLVRVFPSNTGRQYLSFMAECYHEEDLHTIPLSMVETFMELAEIELNISLYKILSKFQNINSVYGEINLNLDMLSDAKSEKKELIEKLRMNKLKNSRNKKWIIA